MNDLLLTGLWVNSIILPLQLTIVDYNVVIPLHFYSLAAVNKFEDAAMIAEVIQRGITIDGAIGWHPFKSSFIFVGVRIRILEGASLNHG
jgi:hypothetical protein